jgi:hypothetical protein
MGFEPLPAIIHEADQAHPHITAGGGQGGEFVASCLGFGVESIEGFQALEPKRLVIEKCDFLSRGSSRVGIERLVGLVYCSSQSGCEVRR